MGVFGAVALIVKMDDVGLHLAGRSNCGAQALGRGLVKAMPVLLKALSIIGTAAMIWVGGGIIVHGLETFGLGEPAHLIHDVAAAVGHLVPAMSGAVEWLAGAAGAGLFGLVVGVLIAAVHHAFARRRSPQAG